MTSEPVAVTPVAVTRVRIGRSPRLPRVEAPSGPTGEEFSAAVTAATAMFGDPTRRRIYLAARDALEGITAAEAAERFELHPNVARHHLDKLAAGGYLDVAADAREGKSGRPSKRYRTTGKPIDMAATPWRTGGMTKPSMIVGTCSMPSILGMEKP